MNRNIKLTIEYDGTNFQGWQIQPKGQRTVQGEIEGALQKIFKKKIKLIGSGRTDSGVHALGQVGNFLPGGQRRNQAEMSGGDFSNDQKKLSVLDKF